MVVLNTNHDASYFQVDQEEMLIMYLACPVKIAHSFLSKGTHDLVDLPY